MVASDRQVLALAKHVYKKGMHERKEKTTQKQKLKYQKQ